VGLVGQILRLNRRDDQPLVRFPHLAHQPFDFGAGVRRGLSSAKRHLPQPECVLAPGHRFFSRDQCALALAPRRPRRVRRSLLRAPHG